MFLALIVFGLVSDWWRAALLHSYGVRASFAHNVHVLALIVFSLVSDRQTGVKSMPCFQSSVLRAVWSVFCATYVLSFITMVCSICT